MSRILVGCIVVYVGCASAEDYRIEQASMKQRYRACQADRGRECGWVGDWLMREFRFEEAHALYRRACARGEHGGCVRAIERFGDHDLLAVACEHAVDSCVDLALFPSTTIERREAAIMRVCKERSSRCAELVERLIRRSIEVGHFIKTSCASTELDARTCGELGLLGWADPTTGVDLVRAACDAGDPQACGQVARRASDPTIGVDAARRACQLGHRPACDREQADLVEEGLRARCRANDASSCERLGRMLVAP